LVCIRVIITVGRLIDIDEKETTLSAH
jgi:hypothetical protein